MPLAGVEDEEVGRVRAVDTACRAIERQGAGRKGREGLAPVHAEVAIDGLVPELGVPPVVGPDLGIRDEPDGGPGGYRRVDPVALGADDRLLPRRQRQGKPVEHVHGLGHAERGEGDAEDGERRAARRPPERSRQYRREEEPADAYEIFQAKPDRVGHLPERRLERGGGRGPEEDGRLTPRRDAREPEEHEADRPDEHRPQTTPARLEQRRCGADGKQRHEVADVAVLDEPPGREPDVE